MFNITVEGPWTRLSPTASNFSLITSQTTDLSLLVKELLACESKIEIKAAILEFVHSQNSTFALAFISRSFVIACVDHVRSIPLFFQVNDDQFALGSNPILFSSKRALSNDKNLVAEFLLTGYLHGKATLSPDIQCLEPGEILEWDFKSKTVAIDQYFSYFPQSSYYKRNFNELFEEFDVVLNEIFSDLYSRKQNLPIWIPLSGGLDSRLILAKSLEHGFEDITTFSYGTSGNHEIGKARTLTRELGVRWHCWPATSARYSRNLFAHDDRRKYVDYSAGLQATPVYLDYEAITGMRRAELIPDHACVINGYSGDFLFGGHIPETFAFDPSLNTLVDAVLSKHCSHFNLDVFPDALARIRDNLVDQFSTLSDINTLETIAAAYENWEWRERQPKAVINGQRLYEFYGLDWALPFWDKRLLLFWAKIPVQWKINQQFHVQYLKKYNYLGMFAKLRSENKVWPTGRPYVPLLLRVIHLLFGRRTHDAVYERAFYYGYFHNQLSFFPYQDYVSLLKKTRQPRIVPLATLEYLRSLGISGLVP